MNRLLFLSLLSAPLVSACGGGACHAELSGNFSASSDSSCPTMGHAAVLPAAPAMPQDWLLDFQILLGATTGTLQISVDLGLSPGSGQFSSETVTNWSAVIGSATDCLYTAANDAVPAGSFSLDLTSVEGLDGAKPTAHGDLKIVQYVHAPPGVDCGEGDLEHVSVSF